MDSLEINLLTYMLEHCMDSFTTKARSVIGNPFNPYM